MVSLRWYKFNYNEICRVWVLELYVGTDPNINSQEIIMWQAGPLRKCWIYSLALCLFGNLSESEDQGLKTQECPSLGWRSLYANGQIHSAVHVKPIREGMFCFVWEDKKRSCKAYKKCRCWEKPAPMWECMSWFQRLQETRQCSAEGCIFRSWHRQCGLAWSHPI